MCPPTRVSIYPRALFSEALRRVAEALDPSALAVDPAALAVDPSALAVDPSTLALDPSGLAVDPSTLALDPTGLAVDPSTLAVDPTALAVDPSALAVNPSTLALDPSGLAVDPTGLAVDPSALAVDPTALAVDPSSLALDPSALAVDLSGLAVDPSGLAVDPSGLALGSFDGARSRLPQFGRHASTGDIEHGSCYSARVRNERRRRPCKKPRSQPDVERALHVQEVARRIFSHLSPEHQEVIDKVVLKGLTHSDAAAVLGRSEGTLKSRLIAAKRALLAAAESLLPASQRGPLTSAPPPRRRPSRPLCRATLGSHVHPRAAQRRT